MSAPFKTKHTRAAALAAHKLFGNNAGWITARRTTPVLSDGERHWVSLYDAREADIAVGDGGRWALVCERHGFILQDTNKARAMAHLVAGTEFCDCCRGTCGLESGKPWACQNPDEPHGRPDGAS